MREVSGSETCSSGHAHVGDRVLGALRQMLVHRFADVPTANLLWRFGSDELPTASTVHIIEGAGLVGGTRRLPWVISKTSRTTPWCTVSA